MFKWLFGLANHHEVERLRAEVFQLRERVAGLEEDNETLLVEMDNATANGQGHVATVRHVLTALLLKYGPTTLSPHMLSAALPLTFDSHQDDNGDLHLEARIMSED